MTDTGRVVAAIDIGSNTIKLTVARLDRGRVRPFEGRAEVVRLSEGLAQTGRIREDRIERAIVTIQEFVDFSRSLGAETIMAVATEAARSAANGPAFLQRLTSEVGIDVEVIDGQEEARLTSEGVLAQIDAAGDILIVDIGGGSTELIATRDGGVLDSTSLPIGSGVMTDTFVVADPPTSAELDAIEKEATERAGPFLSARQPFDRTVLVGGVGAFLMRLLDKEEIAPASALDDARRLVMALSAAEVAPITGAPLARARVLPAGFSIARAVNRLAAAPEIESVANGIRIGLLLRAARSLLREETPR